MFFPPHIFIHLSSERGLHSVPHFSDGLISISVRGGKILLYLIFTHLHFVSSQHMSFGTVFDNRSLSDSLIVNAAFQQTLWSVAPICSGGGVAQGKSLWTLFSFSSLKYTDKQTVNVGNYEIQLIAQEIWCGIPATAMSLCISNWCCEVHCKNCTCRESATGIFSSV